MPVDSTSAVYDKFFHRWQKCRDFKEGQERVHAQGETYLPKLDAQDDEQYAAFRMRAMVYNATQRTIDGMTGLVFRKAPQVEVPDSIRPMLANIDMAGETFEGLAQQVVDEVMTVGRAGVLIDFPPADAEVQTRAQADAANRRPFMSSYISENIIDWHVGTLNNAKILTHVRLREITEETKDDDEFETEPVERIRVLDLTDGIYTQTLWTQENSQWVPGETVTPLMGEQPLGFIPFILFGTMDLDPAPEKPPFLDLVNVNLSHYQTTALLEHGARFTALPMAYATGQAADDAPDVFLGSSKMLWLTAPEARAEFLEYTGTGLGALEKRAEVKEQMMAALGARMLAPERRGIEAAETHAIRRGSENSVLSSIARTVSLGLTRALSIFTQWAGADGSGVMVQLNEDYIVIPMTAQQLTALTQALQSGSISNKEYFDALQRGEVISETVTFDEHMRQKEMQNDEPPDLQGDPLDLEDEAA